MKTIIQVIIVAFIVISILLSLPSILKQRDFKVYEDDLLRKTAIAKGLKAIPNNYEDLEKIYKEKDITLDKEKILLGKELFFDTKLSSNDDTSCSTCHLISKNPQEKKIILNALTSNKQPNDMQDANNCVLCHLGDESGTDRLATSVGSNGELNPYHLNTLTILNTSLAKFLTWTGEVKSLEEEVDKAIKSPHQLNMNEKTLLEKLHNDEKYKNMNLNYEDIKISIASYVRTLLTRSSFDRFLEGDNNAINAQAKQGLANFMNFGCSGCHTGMSVGGQSVQRFPLRHFAGIHDLRPNLGSPPDFEIIDNSFPFENKGGFKGRANTNFFRVPILRNVTKTSPYFHNGAVDKIKEAVEIMGRHQLGINLTSKQIDEITAFLKTLEGNIVNYDEGANK
ncbi:cytochrome-c peroxidase [Poseidonibacter lekithochrous]|uniref:cytochrome-c peroxidase n=1 Tax=Poseidonibacter lekithochrous TaxID=1904463 RepID=UPI000D36B6AE|nr:cytochrome c peroxidase [Poseidonibacter lekithochrous]